MTAMSPRSNETDLPRQAVRTLQTSARFERSLARVGHIGCLDECRPHPPNRFQAPPVSLAEFAWNTPEQQRLFAFVPAELRDS
jgi:hypothetical protein